MTSHAPVARSRVQRVSAKFAGPAVVTLRFSLASSSSLVSERRANRERPGRIPLPLYGNRVPSSRWL